MDRGALAKSVSKRLAGVSLEEPVLIYLLHPEEIQSSPEEGWLIQVGEPVASRAPTPSPRRVRGLLWDLRNAAFIEREGAVVWAVYDREFEMSYAGVGYVVQDKDIAEKARESGLIVQEAL